MRKKSENRIIILVAVFFILFTLISLRYFYLSSETSYVKTNISDSFVTINADKSQGSIYDRNMIPLVNREYYYQAVIVPSAVNYDDISDYAVDRNYFDGKFKEGKPFSFICKSGLKESAGLTVFRIPKRYSGRQTAQHIIGYISENKGVSGIEYAYDRILRNDNNINSVTYSTDGFGNVLIGDGKSVRKSKSSDMGTVLTIDKNIQEICENTGRFMKKAQLSYQM